MGMPTLPKARACIVPLLLLAACGRVSEDPVVEEAKRMAAPEPPSAEEQALNAALGRIGDAFDGRVGIAVHDLQSGATVHFNGLDLLPQQSVSKLWVALTALEQVDEGELALSDRVTIRTEDLTLFHQPIRNELRRRGGPITTTVADLMARAIIESDNTANDALLRRVGGPDAVRRFLARRGLGSIRFGPGEREMQSAIAGLEWRQDYAAGRSFYEARDEVPDGERERAFEAYLADPVDGAAPVALAGALARVAKGEIVSDQSTAHFLDLLRRVRSGPNRLKGGLPPGWSIGHKTGTGQVWGAEQSGYNDVAILTAPDGDRYAVAVMIARTGMRVPDRMAMMHEVVAAVAEYAAGADEATARQSAD
jgi:beta-lactamase class A